MRRVKIRTLSANKATRFFLFLVYVPLIFPPLPKLNYVCKNLFNHIRIMLFPNNFRSERRKRAQSLYQNQVEMAEKKREIANIQCAKVKKEEVIFSFVSLISYMSFSILYTRCFYHFYTGHSNYLKCLSSRNF